MSFLSQKKKKKKENKVYIYILREIDRFRNNTRRHPPNIYARMSHGSPWLVNHRGWLISSSHSRVNRLQSITIISRGKLSPIWVLVKSSQIGHQGLAVGVSTSRERSNIFECMSSFFFFLSWKKSSDCSFACDLVVYTPHVFVSLCLISLFSQANYRYKKAKKMKYATSHIKGVLPNFLIVRIFVFLTLIFIGCFTFGFSFSHFIY